MMPTKPRSLIMDFFKLFYVGGMAFVTVAMPTVMVVMTLYTRNTRATAPSKARRAAARARRSRLAMNLQPRPF
jgi:hypothetical protein